MSISAFLPDMRRRTIRGDVNPLDKSTIISIYPKHIREKKDTIQPGKFEIPPGTYEKPSLLVIGSSSWWKEIDEESPLLEIPVSSIQVANSIVNDFCNGLLACDMSTAMPGLFFIPGAITLQELLAKHHTRLDAALTKQKKWYLELVKIADSLWARSNGNPLAISDDMRMGARELGLNAKEWLQNYQHYEMIRCVACGSMRNPQYPVCPMCKAVVDVELAKKLNLKFAE